MVSSARLGPCQLKKYETRLAIDANDELSEIGLPFSRSSTLNNWYCPYITPTNTPIFLSFSALLVYPASSSVFQTVSRKMRSCGSITCASRGEMLKNRGSNLSTSRMKPPHLLLVLPGVPASGE